MLAPLAAARERRGVSVRVVPFDRSPSQVGPSTRLVACSHVSWITGQVVGRGGAGRPPARRVLLDGAQGLGAIPVDVGELGCDFYAAVRPEVDVRPQRHRLPLRAQRSASAT